MGTYLVTWYIPDCQNYVRSDCERNTSSASRNILVQVVSRFWATSLQVMYSKCCRLRLTINPSMGCVLVPTRRARTQRSTKARQGRKRERVGYFATREGDGKCSYKREPLLVCSEIPRDTFGTTAVVVRCCCCCVPGVRTTVLCDATRVQPTSVLGDYYQYYDHVHMIRQLRAQPSQASWSRWSRPRTTFQAYVQ